MSIKSELDRLSGSIASAYSAVREQGGELPAARTSGNLAGAIRSIPKGGGSSEPLDPKEIYQNTRPADWLPMPSPNENEIYLLFHIRDGGSALLAFTVTCTGSYTVAIDGNEADMLASGTKFETELFADNYGSLTSDGMKQAMVKITGTDIKTWEPAIHSKKTSPSNFAGWNIVEIACRLPKGTMTACGSSTANLVLKKLRYFTWAKENSVTNVSKMFNGCYSLTAILELDTAKVADMSGMFNNCYSLTAIPKLDTAKVTNMSSMFNGCYSLTAVPELDTAKVTDMSSMFNYCYSLTAIPELDTAQVTNMSNMFYGCHSLTTVPRLNTAKVTNMSSMFYTCRSLTAVPELDTAQVTNMPGMFGYCHSLTAIPELDTSQVADMSSMFNGCYSLIAIPELDTSQATNMSSMFSNCYSLTVVPELDTAKTINMSSMFNNCYSLTAVPKLDTAKAGNMSSAFNCCYALASILFNPSATGWAGYAVSLKDCSLSHKAIVDLFNSLPTITSSKALALTGNPGVSELTAAEKAIATSKKWTLTL